jgi:hypothetical protein
MSKWLKVAKGAALAGAGAALAYLIAVDWSNLGPLYAALASSVLNALYQYLRTVPTE